MSKQQLIDYLRIVSQVEGELMTLRETLQKSSDTVKSLRIPVKINKREYVPDRSVIKNREAFGKLGMAIYVWFQVTVHIFVLAIGNMCFESIGSTCTCYDELGVALIIETVLLIGGGVLYFIIACVLKIKDYIKFRKNTSAGRANAESDYKKALRLETLRLKKECDISDHIIATTIAPTEKRITYLESELEKLYSLNIIYPTYRNIIAVAQILEYLESGICEKLEGTDGAYAQFMLDVRAQRVIDSIEKLRVAVEDEMARLAISQHIMCGLIRESNNHLRNIEATVGTISTQLDGIHSTLNSMHDTQLTATQYLNDTNKQLTRIANSYDRTAVEAAAIGANQRTQMLRDGISQYRIKYPA